MTNSSQSGAENNNIVTQITTVLRGQREINAVINGGDCSLGRQIFKYGLAIQNEIGNKCFIYFYHKAIVLWIWMNMVMVIEQPFPKNLQLSNPITKILNKY